MCLLCADIHWREQLAFRAALSPSFFCHTRSACPTSASSPRAITIALRFNVLCISLHIILMPLCVYPHTTIGLSGIAFGDCGSSRFCVQHAKYIDAGAKKSLAVILWLSVAYNFPNIDSHFTLTNYQRRHHDNVKISIFLSCFPTV